MEETKKCPLCNQDLFENIVWSNQLVRYCHDCSKIFINDNEYF